MLLASRDLPPPPRDAVTDSVLPRSPDPMSEDALLFASRAGRRGSDAASAKSGAQLPLPSIAHGTDLGAVLDAFERTKARDQLLREAGEARRRLVEQLASGKPAQDVGLQLVEPASSGEAGPQADIDADRIDSEVEAELARALDTLRHLAALARR